MQKVTFFNIIDEMKKALCDLLINYYFFEITRKVKTYRS